MQNAESVTVREWDAEVFHRRVIDLEAAGYAARLDSYRVLPEMDPETGEVIHLRTVEMDKVLSTSAEEKAS
jgi:hypothetical protein